ncbi:MAG: ABC transporter permease subunit [Streptosporangiales bacterium]|nr:ABC transporter permease subunit [Streptosporangiales bacterium]
MSSPGDSVAPPRYRRLLGRTRETWIQYATLVVVLLLVLAPLVPTLIQSFLSEAIFADDKAFTAGNYGRMFTEADFGQVIVNSLQLAALTTVIAMVLSVALAVVLIRIRIPGGGVMSNMLLWPIYISPLVLAFGFIIIYGPAGYVSKAVSLVTGEVPWNLYTIPGMAVTSAVAYIPLGYLYCSNALRIADTSLENAARTCGARPWRVIWSVILPMLRPPIMYASLLIFTAALEELSIPLLYGSPVGIDTFASFIFTRGLTQANPDYGILGASSIFVLLILGVLVTIQALVLRNSRRFVSVRGKASREHRFEVGRGRWVAFALVVLYLVLGPLLPLFGLVARAFTQVLSPLVSPFEVLSLGNFQVIFGYRQYVGAIGNSLFIALVGAILTTLLMAVAVLVARRSNFRFARPVEVTALAPQALPGTILGLGFFWAFLFIAPISWVQGTVLALIIAFSVRAFPQAFGAIAPMVMQISEELDQAARSVGADWWRTFSRILLRLVTPALLSSFVLLFVQMFKEFSPAVFLGSADSEIIGTTALTLWQNGNTGAVAALSCIQIAIIAIVVFVAGKVLKVRSHA